MARAISIHIGVNRPAGRHGDQPLQHSENSAWRMAELANRAGYDSLLVLRGALASRQSVHNALTAAAGSLVAGDHLLVTFSGHGCQQPDTDEDRDERCGIDEGWCLADGILLDDKLAGYWRLFEPGVRIVLVVESCYSAGMRREDRTQHHGSRPPGQPVMRGRPRPSSGLVWRSVAAAPGLPCIAEPPADADGIRASVLMLSASSEEQTSRDGLFTEHLLKVWNNGDFEGTYCDLYRAVREAVTCDHCNQHPQILMLGAPDPGFPNERAFYLRRRVPGQGPVYRGT